MKVAKPTQTKDTPFQSMEYQTLVSGIGSSGNT
jgi:hypothetical protein